MFSCVNFVWKNRFRKEANHCSLIKPSLDLIDDSIVWISKGWKHIITNKITIEKRVNLYRYASTYKSVIIGCSMFNFCLFSLHICICLDFRFRVMFYFQIFSKHDSHPEKYEKSQKLCVFTCVIRPYIKCMLYLLIFSLRWAITILITQGNVNWTVFYVVNIIMLNDSKVEQACKQNRQHESLKKYLMKCAIYGKLKPIVNRYTKAQQLCVHS